MPTQKENLTGSPGSTVERRRFNGSERLLFGTDLNGANLRVVWGKITLDFT